MRRFVTERATCRFQAEPRCSELLDFYVRLRVPRHTLAILAVMCCVHPKVDSGVVGHRAVGLTLDTRLRLLHVVDQPAAAEMVATLEE
jgi:hypothetical protein